MRVHVLGPTAVIDSRGRELDLGPHRHAEVLALLAAFSGDRVHAESLIDMLWLSDPPGSASTTLQGYIARLRKVFEPGRANRAASTSIVTVGAGYRLALETDAQVFAWDLLAAQRDAEVDPASAAQLLTDALAMWRGPAFVDVAEIPAVTAEAERLEELRLAAEETRARLLLTVGDTTDLIGRLHRLVADNPLRERMCGLLALALYRSGQQAQALTVIRQLQTRLLHELGVDPGPEIVALQQQILRHDESLRVDATASIAPVPDFVGRATELARLRECWRSTTRGHVVTVTVRGESGIGKSTLAQRIAADVGASGAAVRWGRCVPDPGAPPYWPWIQIFATRAAGKPIAHAEAGRYVFALDAAARVQAMGAALIVVDDAQWADADSLMVLDTVLAHLDPTSSVMVLILMRDDAPRASAELPRLLATVARRDQHVDLRLRGMNDSEVAQLLSSRGARDDSAARAEHAAAIARRTGGNPFFVRALAGLDADQPAPQTVRDVIAAQVNELPTGGIALVRALALSTTVLRRSDAAAIAKLAEVQAAQTITSALRAGLIAEGAPGHLQIAHDVVREAILAETPPEVAQAMHARLGDLLESGPASAAAEHLLAAGQSERGAQAALRAASQALEAAALDEAVGWAVRAAAATADDGLGCDAMIVAGTAARRAGRLDDSTSYLESAADAAHRCGNIERLGAVALASVPGGVGGYWALFGVPTLGSSALLDEAIAVLDRFAPPVRARLLAAQATQLCAAGQPGAADIARRALVEAGDDVGARAQCLVAMALTVWNPAAVDEQWELITELLTYARGDHALAATAVHLQRCALLMMGRSAESSRAARRFTDLAKRSRDPDLALLDLWWEIGMHLMRGHVDDARALAEQASEAAAHLDSASQSLDRGSRATVDGIAAWYEGTLIDEIGEAAELAVDFHPDFLLVSALGQAEAGHVEEALAAIDRLLALPAEGSIMVARTVMISEALVALRDADRLATLLPRLESYAGRNVVLWPGDTCLGPGSLYYGAALGVLGRHDEARRELRAAVLEGEAIGALPFVERARRRLAELP